MNLIEKLNHRYATKRMTSQKIKEDDIEEILEAIRLAPSAYGLQPFNVIVTDNKELLQEINKEACKQIIISQCSHLLIFKSPNNLSADDIENYLSLVKELRNEDEEYIQHNREKLMNLVNNPAINNKEWISKQVYIALAYASIAAVNLGIDSTPMEGFNPSVLDQVLGLDTDKEGTRVLMALGYREEDEDTLSKKPKVRKPMNQMFERI